MNIFKWKSRPPLIDEARNDAVRMLEMGQEMFELVTVSMAQDTLPGGLATIKQMDKEINRIHRDVRKKAFEHLSITGNKELFTSLVLLSVVDDSERIGDYNKNIGELIHLLPKKLDFQKHGETFDRLWKDTGTAFELTLKAFRDDDEEAAHRVLSAYGGLSDTCDDVIDDIIGVDSGSIPRDLVGLMLLLRYFKRVNAHLKNIASTVVNPFHRIGYKPKSGKRTTASDEENDV